MDEQQQPVETELKFTFPEEARAAIERHPALARAATETVAQHAIYYDTSDLALSAAGFGLRVRRNGDQFVQTLKRDTGAGGVAAARGEWEWDRPDETPDAALLRETPAAEFAAIPLQPVFEVTVTRILRQLALPGGAQVELALDRGHITAGRATAPVREMELELKSGPLAPLYQLAIELHAALPLRILAESKAARGYWLRTGQAPVPAKAEMPGLDRDVTGHAGFRGILGSALAGLTHNQAPAEAGDIEGTHQMRVAIRKLRAALVLFQPLLEPHAAAQFNSALQRLGHVLGEARDWDVFCTETLPAAQADAAQANRLGLLREAAEERRVSAYEALRAELAAPAITGVALGLAAWAEDEKALGEAALGRPLAETAPALLDRVAEKTAKRGRHLGTLSPEALHRLRKMLKKLRYGAEYLSGLYDGKLVKRYLEPVKELQELLGQINDAHMAPALAERLCEGEALDRVPGLAEVSAWAAIRGEAAMAKLPKAWQGFEDSEPFWTGKG